MARTCAGQRKRIIEYVNRHLWAFYLVQVKLFQREFGRDNFVWPDMDAATIEN